MKASLANVGSWNEDSLVRLPIHRTLAFRLFAFISLLLFLSLGTNAWHNAKSFHSMLMLGIQDKTMQNARRTANGADAVIDSWVSQLIVITNGLSGVPRTRYEELIRGFASSNPEFVTVQLLVENKGKKRETLVAASFPNPEDERFMGQRADVVVKKLGAVSKAWLDESLKKHPQQPIFLGNMMPKVGLPLISVALPFPVKDSDQKLWALLTAWQTKLYGALSSGGVEQVLLLDGDGRVVSGSDVKLIAGNLKKLKSNPLVRDFKSDNTPFGFKQWRGPEGQTTLGAYARLPKFNLVAVTESDGQPAYEAVRRILMRSLLWAALLLLASVLFSYAAAASITSNLSNLMATTLKIAGGEFKARVAVKSRDEVGLLGQAVNHMGSQIDGLMADRLEKARLEAELQTAKIVQEAFFPKELVKEDHFRIASFFQPATECGGDWWGYYRLSPTHRLICIADATGHGVPAALVTAMVFAAASIMSRRLMEGSTDNYSPAELLSELNRTLCATVETKLTMTFFVAILDLGRGELHFSNAGHNFPMMIRKQPSDRRRFSLQSVNNPLGMYPDSTYTDAATLPIYPGDRIFLYTDGLIECTDKAGQQWGRRRFQKTVDKFTDIPLDEFKEALVKTAYGHFAGQPADDDITVVIVEVDEHWQANPQLLDKVG